MDFSINSTSINMNMYIKPIQPSNLPIKDTSDFPSKQAEAIQKNLLELDEQGKLLNYFKEQYQDLGKPNSLANYILEDFENRKHLFIEWTGIETFSDKHIIKRIGVRLSNIAYGSTRYFLWKCSKCQHEWVTKSYNRAGLNCKCPACNEYKSACIPGVNDLETWCNTQGAYGQQLKDEFVGQLEDGTPISIDSISRGSNAKVWWRCSNPNCRYEWKSTPNNRTQPGRYGCAACAGNICIPGVNDLETFCKENTKYIYLLDEFVGKDEDENPIEANEVTKSSNNKVKWKCSNKDCNYEWYASPNHRTAKESGCPACAKNKFIPGINDFLTWCKSQGAYGKKLLSEFKGEDEDGNIILPSQITRASNKKVKWKCSNKDCNYEWTAVVSGRTGKQRRGCPSCGGTSLIKGKNDLETFCKQHSEFDYILREFVGIDENKNLILPSQIAKGSHKKVWFKCKDCNQEWLTELNSRITNKSGCPYCNKNGTSFPEQFIFNSLKQLFPDILSRAKDPIHNFEYDITIPSLKLCIEYSGYGWHQDKLEHDIEKEEHCKSHNIQFLQIYAHSGNIKDTDGDTAQDTYEKNQILYKVERDKTLHIIQLQQIIKFILQEYAPNHSIEEIDFNLSESEANKVMDKV